ncbi:hypothetical protein Tco_0727042 [Tanacetum coccineum]|uniref:Uncharacterized protein n=1 Tax=Tanacetum coccineum TaxID=301880 RepID=A0ABQ4YJJ3_9ASTR
MDDEDAGKPVAEYFSIERDAPGVIAFTGNEDARKFFMEGELTSKNIKNDGDVKIVVGNKFDEIVLDESKDVLLESDGYPTILFFSAGNKSFDQLQITVDTDRTAKAFYKFIKQHAAIPFKLQKPESTQKAESTEKSESTQKSESIPESSNQDLKD